MSKKAFTPEEMEVLRGNKYTYAVTPHKLSLTKEFKEAFMDEYNAGIMPRQILEEKGYPAYILGNERIWGITQVIKKQAASSEGLREGRPLRTSKPTDDAVLTTEEAVRRLQGEVQYLRQEVEFLKKISSIRTTRK